MKIEMAGLIIDMKLAYPYTAQMAERYRYTGERPVDFSVSVSPDEIDAESGEDGKYPRRYLESLAIYRKICSSMLDYDTFLFHASVISVDGQAVAFTAPSGTGKSTHAALWRSEYGDRVSYVNDDKPLIAVKKDGIFACGTPWDGKHRRSNPVCVPLRAVCYIERSQINETKAVSSPAIYPRLLGQCYRPADEAGLTKTLTLFDRMVFGVPQFVIRCNIEPDAARVAYRAIFGD